MPNHLTLGQLVRELRKRAELTQQELAAEIGIARSTLASIETGSDLPGRETLLALADFFQVPVDQLRSRTGRERRPSEGELVKDPDELALLRYWRGLTDDQKVLVTKLLTPNRR